MRRLLYVLLALLSPVLMGQGYAGPMTTGGSAGVAGTLCKSATPAATTGTIEQVLATCSLPAGLLSANGSHIRFQIQATTAANANNKTLKVYLSASGGGLAGSVCYTSGAAASNNEIWVPSAPGVMFPTGAATGRCSHNLWRGAKGGATAITAMVWHTDQLAQTWANALDIVISGTTPTSAGDLTLTGYTIEVAQ